MTQANYLDTNNIYYDYLSADKNTMKSIRNYSL